LGITWGGLVGGRGHRKGQLRVLGSPSARRTKEPRTGGPPGGRGVRGPDFFLRKSLRTYLRVLNPDCRPPGPIGTTTLARYIVYLRHATIFVLADPFDSRWVPPVGGAPSRHRHRRCNVQRLGYTAQCQSDSGAGHTSLVVVPRSAARRSQVVPHSKQLGSQTRRCRAEQATGQVASRGDARTGKRARTGGARSPKRGQRNFGTRNCVLLGICANKI
jgi:hypothetical protein